MNLKGVAPNYVISWKTSKHIVNNNTPASRVA